MIANTSSGRRFGPLATYLVFGRSGTETDRVAWTAGRNLGTDDPELAAPLMQATARQSALVQVPVYHLTISFDREDKVTPDQMQAVADHVLSDLGLAAHQAMMVAHKDREHAHVHVMVNRVHPETGLAWERWRDRPTIERALREAERAFALRVVPGRLHQLDVYDVSVRATLTPGELREAERSDDPAFVHRVRARLPEFRAARSWDELTIRLTAHGLRVEGKGQGLVITDGEHQAKASRVGRDLSLRRLEARFGTPYPDRGQLTAIPIRAQEQLSPAAAAVASAATEYEYVAALARAKSHADQDLALLRTRRQSFEHTLVVIPRATEAFDRQLAHVYREPETARAQIRAIAATLGAVRVETMLRTEPDRFGVLNTEAKTRVAGLLTVHDDSKARLAARGAATEWNSLASHEAESVKLVIDYVRGVEQRFSDALARAYRDPEAASRAFELALGHAGPDEAIRTLAESPERLGALLAHTTPAQVSRLALLPLAERAREAVDARLVTSTELAEAHVSRAVATVDERRRGLRDSLDHAPGPDLLQRMIGRAAHRLEPAELGQLRRALTAPQTAIVFKAHEAVRDIVLGREERDR
ncbi:MAG: relaxase/mobilization nuclease domain-containing protein [Gemmatimonadaceae bacterium]